jgi:outer membrane protein assembly factor BamB
VTHCHAPRWVIAASLLLLALGANAIADNWPQWRGPDNNGISKEKNLPAEWSDTKNVAWKVKLPGAGSGTPAVWGDRIFVTCDDGKDLLLLCLNTKGEEVWKKKVASSSGRNYKQGEANEASPSTSTDGKHVYCYFGTGDLACFDFEGKEVWKFNVQDRYGKMRFQWGGIHSTPLLHGDRLYVQLLNANGAKVVALDKASGAEVWKIDRESDGRGEGKEVYASPILGHNGKEEYLIVHGNDYATGHRLSDGSEIWRVGDLNNKNRYNTTFRFVTSPTATADMILVPSCKEGPLVAIKPDATGRVAPGGEGELWRYKHTPDVCCPVVADGLVYLCDNNGNLTCLDAKTGAEKYSERTHPAIYRASPVYADGKIFLTGQDGVTTVVKAGPKFELLATNKLPDKINATPVIAEGRIYIRGFDALYAIGK